MMRTTPPTILAVAAISVVTLTAGTVSGQDSSPEPPEKASERPAGLMSVDALAKRHPALRVCDRGGIPSTGAARFEGKRNRLLAATSSPRHYANDVFATPGKPVVVEAKFTYGRVSKDLEGARVEALFHTCYGWHNLGVSQTDDDGWAKFSFSAPKQPGIHALVFRVVGDGSTASTRVFVVPEQTAIAVFDLDGTLTQSDAEIRREVTKDYFVQLGAGKYEPAAWPGARELTEAAVEVGYLPIYLSGRPYWLLDHSRDWLARNGFAPGAVIHTKLHSEVAPNQKGVGEFKRGVLVNLSSQNLRIERAFGNALTDAWAYSEAGIASDSTWIIGEHADAEKHNAALDDWTEVGSALRSGERVAQPFDPPPKSQTTEGVEPSGN